MLKQIKNLRAHSEAAWEGCVDTAHDEDAASEAMESALDLWDDAIAAIEGGDLGRAKVALEGARSIESEWGDSSDSSEALLLFT